MTSLMFVFHLTCLFFGRIGDLSAQKMSSSLHPDGGLLSVKIGDNLTLPCFYNADAAARFYWYKQTLGQKPQLISTLYKFDKNGTFHGEFKNNPRFTLDIGDGKNHLRISDLHISDSATYYCVSCSSIALEITVSITVSVTGSALVIQSASKIVQPGGSVTLNCTVLTGTCDGEHCVYWFKHSQEAHPGLIYTHGGRNDQCERKDNTQTHTCVYNLPMKSLNLSHAGTYYCAVASCGHILFGSGTKLFFEYGVDSPVLVYFLSGALTFTTILVVLLALSMFNMKKRNSNQSTESQARLSASSTTNAVGHGDADDLHYAALSFNLPNRSRRQRNNTNSECMYSSVKH
ncbi:uncharacterized protein LOC115589433 [Sparus aurata]|uniref:uncharacterized protein LOC115589433 n=1 Tax=Sparus aurata TaxID=8175 RepID=UPI0011C1B598|nr:uncharacterized protein LOC115589433 [Sparus aurata]